MAKVKFFNKPALAISLFVALLHAVWALAIALGIGQMYLDWIYPLHFIGNPFTTLPFNFLSALLLVVVAFVVTYLSVVLFMLVWKWAKAR